jgi:hypothetical protein
METGYDFFYVRIELLNNNQASLGLKALKSTTQYSSCKGNVTNRDGAVFVLNVVWFEL